MPKAKRNKTILPNEGTVKVTAEFSYYMGGGTDDSLVDAMGWLQCLRDELKGHCPDSIKARLPDGIQLDVPIPE